MRYFTPRQCEEWMTVRQRQPTRLDRGLHRKIPYPSEGARYYGLCRELAFAISESRAALLRVTEPSIWPSSENLHLYYSLRRYYGDNQLIDEAPGHLFLGHETQELATFLQIVFLNGWDGYVVTEAGYVDIAFSHDEYLTVFADDESNLNGVLTALGITG